MEQEIKAETESKGVGTYVRIEFLIKMLDSRDAQFVTAKHGDTTTEMVIHVSTFDGENRDKIKKELFKLLDIK